MIVDRDVPGVDYIIICRCAVCAMNEKKREDPIRAIRSLCVVTPRAVREV